jgi:hypothetical protein
MARWNMASGAEAQGRSSAGDCGRLVTALLLSVVGTLWTRRRSVAIDQQKPRSADDRRVPHDSLRPHLSTLQKHSLQARFQLAVDVLLVTWLVWNSNVIQSPYVALYIVIIASRVCF